MAIRMKFEDVLTLLSLKNPDEVLRVTFKGRKGPGYLLYRDGEVRRIEYGILRGEKALETLLKEREVGIYEIQEIVSSSGMELLTSFINEHLGKIEHVKGFAIIDDHGEPYINNLPEPSEEFLRDIVENVLPSLVKGVALSTKIIESELEDGTVIFGVKLKPELNAVVVLNSRKSLTKVKILFSSIVRITGL